MNWSTTLPRELWHEAKPLFCLCSLSLQPIRLLLWAETSSLLLLLPWTEHHLLLCFGLLIVAFISQCRNTLNSEDSLLFLSIVPSQRSIHVNTGLQIRSTLIWLSLKKKTWYLSLWSVCRFRDGGMFVRCLTRHWCSGVLVQRLGGRWPFSQTSAFRCVCFTPHLGANPEGSDRLPRDRRRLHQQQLWQWFLSGSTHRAERDREREQNIKNKTPKSYFCIQQTYGAAVAFYSVTVLLFELQKAAVEAARVCQRCQHVLQSLLESCLLCCFLSLCR